MKILPLVSDSLGVRSLSVYVETKDCKICIDPSAALGPSRYGLPPTEEEIIVLSRSKEIIHNYVEKSDILVISHYHYDHYDPHEDFYDGKVVLAKNRLENINYSQKKRGYMFEKIVKEKCELFYCDNQTYQFGDTEIKFSSPQPHGPVGTRLGYVLMTTIDDGYRLTHASDVEGPVSKETTREIITEFPELLIIDGPPTYLLGYRFSNQDLEKTRDNLQSIIENLDCEIILDHHLLRDLYYRDKLKKIYDMGKVKTFAEYLGRENNMLEAHRKDYYQRQKKP